eukprot:7008507-Lingulodinium_polyedra.AAC.1
MKPTPADRPRSSDVKAAPAAKACSRPLSRLRTRSGALAGVPWPAPPRVPPPVGVQAAQASAATPD